MSCATGFVILAATFFLFLSWEAHRAEFGSSPPGYIDSLQKQSVVDTDLPPPETLETQGRTEDPVREVHWPSILYIT